MLDVTPEVQAQVRLNVFRALAASPLANGKDIVEVARAARESAKVLLDEDQVAAD